MNITKILTIIVLGLIIVSCKPTEEVAKEEQVSNNIPVEILKIKAESFNHYFEVKANVEAIEYAMVSPEVPAQIKKIFVNEGQRVNKGDVILKQNSLVVAGQIQGVKTQLNLAEITYNKQKELWLNQKVGSEIQYLQAKTQYEGLQEQLKTLNSQIAMYQIKAPFSGIIDKINVKEGELASPGMRAIEMVNLNKIKLIADVSEAYLPVINKGDTVDISFTTYPNDKFREVVYRTGNIINPSNRTFEVEIRAKNINNKFKPNMVSTLLINDYKKDSAFIVPSIIIKKDFEKQFVFIAEKNDTSTIAKKIFVETGRSYKDKTIITKGMKIGDKVIVKGYNIVSNGSQILINNK